MYTCSNACTFLMQQCIQDAKVMWELVLDQTNYESGCFISPKNKKKIGHSQTEPSFVLATIKFLYIVIYTKKAAINSLAASKCSMSLNYNRKQWYISRVPDQNGVSRLYIIVKIYHFGQKPSICNSTHDSFIESKVLIYQTLKCDSHQQTGGWFIIIDKLVSLKHW